MPSSTATAPQGKRQLQKTYVAKAKQQHAEEHIHNLQFGAQPAALGTEYGFGLGMYFYVLRWLQWMMFWMILCAVPFIIVIGCAVFTDSEHKDSHAQGVKKYPDYEIHSMTFAAIVDNTVDNGTLQYMNIEMAGDWLGPSKKGSFLIWISLVDAAAILVFFIAAVVLAAQARRFIAAVDRDTIEVADYTVIVCGLPHNVDAAEIGEHFARYGEIMDVVLVTSHMGKVLYSCGRASHLEQRMQALHDQAELYDAVVYQQRADKLAAKLAKTMEQVKTLSPSAGRVKAAFVTFNSQNERKTCTARCPSGWLASLIQKKQDRFRGSKRFWVRQASTPEDYIFENLGYTQAQVTLRMVLVRVVVALMVLLCAVFITKLTDMSNQQTSQLVWYEGKLEQGVAGAVPPPGTAFASVNATCSAQLSGFCTQQLQQLQSVNLSLAYGSNVTWPSARAQLLNERNVRLHLQACAAAGTDSDAAPSDCQPTESSCLSCYCQGLRARYGDRPALPMMEHIESYCSPYINQFDMQTWGIRIAISLVVAVINSVLKWLLAWLVLLEKRWTQTQRERSFAVLCFVATLINSVVVLLVVNCSSLTELAQEHGAAWLQNFVLFGTYGDFTPDWYENVGLSIVILMMINVAGPAITLLSELAKKLMERCFVLRIQSAPTQEDYNQAWSKPRFTLEQRTADLLLNVTLALLFGSGMPLCYLVLLVYLLVADLVDRLALMRLGGGCARYNKGLPSLVVALLPWAAVAHCAFGLWMHTYFKVEMSDTTLSDAVHSSGTQLDNWSYGRRITQPNGIALFLVLIAMVAWLLVGRYIAGNVVACMSRLCGACLLRSLHRLFTPDELEVQPTYAEALAQPGCLHGVPTYRITHNPRYQQHFTAHGLADGSAMADADGKRRVYTRLKTKGRARLFEVLPEPITDLNLSKLDEELGCDMMMPADSVICGEPCGGEPCELIRAVPAEELLGRQQQVHARAHVEPPALMVVGPRQVVVHVSAESGSPPDPASRSASGDGRDVQAQQAVVVASEQPASAGAPPAGSPQPGNRSSGNIRHVRERAQVGEAEGEKEAERQEESAP